MRLIDADALKEMLIKERDSIPLSKTERYSFGVGLPNPHGMAMRGGVNKAFRCMEQTPTIDPESLRPQGKWEEKEDMNGVDVYYTCSVCKEDFVTIDGTPTDNLWNYCPNCGAKMKGE